MAYIKIVNRTYTFRKPFISESLFNELKQQLNQKPASTLIPETKTEGLFLVFKYSLIGIIPGAIVSLFSFELGQYLLVLPSSVFFCTFILHFSTVFSYQIFLIIRRRYYKILKLHISSALSYSDFKQSWIHL